MNYKDLAWDIVSDSRFVNKKFPVSMRAGKLVEYYKGLGTTVSSKMAVKVIRYIDNGMGKSK